jgi:hypothetical protein
VPETVDVIDPNYLEASSRRIAELVARYRHPGHRYPRREAEPRRFGLDLSMPPCTNLHAARKPGILDLADRSGNSGARF